jgi:hypothetical protein
MKNLLVIHCHTYTFVCVKKGVLFSSINASLLQALGFKSMLQYFLCVCVCDMGSLLSHVMTTCMPETKCLRTYYS